MNALSNLKTDIENLLGVTREETGQISHKATALNILGWMYKNEKQYEMAIDCYVKSLSIQPKQNAAKLHIYHENLKELYQSDLSERWIKNMFKYIEASSDR